MPLTQVKGSVLPEIAPESERYGVSGSTVDQAAAFLVSSSIDSRGDTFLNAERRKSLRYYTSQSDTYPREIVPDEHANATALAKAGYALVGAYKYYVDVRWLQHAQRLGDKILALQWQNPNTARYGGIRLGENAGQASAFTASLSGKFLLSLYAVDPQPKWINAAVRIGDFLKVLNDPNTTYTSLYSETPIPNPTFNSITWNGLCDEIDANDVISITHTTWNLVAVPFLQDLGTATGDSSYTTVATNVLAFGDDGVNTGYDFFAIYNPSPTSKVDTAWPISTNYGFVADHAWHRQGEETLATGTEIESADTAQGGSASTITLQADSNASNDHYNQYVVDITSGTGSGQSRVISDYVGSTKVATVSRDWDTPPDATSVYDIGEAANTIGTDQIEYGLEAMYDGGYSTSTITSTYDTFKGYAHADAGSTTFGDAYDSSICWTGFFRMFVAGPKAFGSYYDGQGAQLYLKQKINTTDFNAAIPAFDAVVEHGALLDENLEKYWAGSDPDNYVTDGTIPLAVSLAGVFRITGDLT